MSPRFVKKRVQALFIDTNNLFPKLGLNSTHGDMSTRYAGVLMGITNGLGNIPGFLATIVAGQFTKNGDTVENWAPVFYLSAAVFGVTTLIYCFFCTAEEQPWGRGKPQTTAAAAAATSDVEADEYGGQTEK